MESSTGPGFHPDAKAVNPPCPSRREVVAAGLAAALPAAAAERTGLAASARQRGRHFGAAVRVGQLLAEPDLKATVLRECARLTPEVELKWDAVEPQRGRLELAAMDDLAAFARDNGKSLRGHTLIWRRSTPAWAFERMADGRDWGPVARHFATVISRYGSVVRDWDVVNEPLDPSAGRADGLKPDPFLANFGPDYIRRALDEAHRFAPRGRLFINEYGLEHDTAEENQRRRMLMRLAERLVRVGAPLKGIGLQAHIDLGKPLAPQPVLRAFVQGLGELGLAVAVTELDVKERELTLPREARDQKAADAVRRYLDPVLDVAAVEGVSTWGLSDRHSWLEVTPEDLARHPGAWKQGEGPGLNRGLPFDATMQKKPLYNSISAALA